jgi:hypothetical protein
MLCIGNFQCDIYAFSRGLYESSRCTVCTTSSPEMLRAGNLHIGHGLYGVAGNEQDETIFRLGLSASRILSSIMLRIPFIICLESIEEFERGGQIADSSEDRFFRSCVDSKRSLR